MERYWNVIVRTLDGRRLHSELILARPSEAGDRAMEILNHIQGGYIVEYGIIR